jgi:hypothetical protein
LRSEGLIAQGVFARTEGELKSDGGRILCDYRLSQSEARPLLLLGAPISASIPLESTACFQGSRYWLLCPMCRCRVLYVWLTRQGEPGCRLCLGLKEAGLQARRRASLDISEQDPRGASADLGTSE